MMHLPPWSRSGQRRSCCASFECRSAGDRGAWHGGSRSCAPLTSRPRGEMSGRERGESRARGGPMAEGSIPVDLLNPGQVFACLGFLEAANELIGNAEGTFDWRDRTSARFHLRAGGEANPFETVLKFLS